MNKWISVKDRLPDIGRSCLIYITWPEGTMFNCRADPLTRTNIRIGGRMFNGIFTTMEGQFLYEELKHVTHWMPLPEKPKKTRRRHNPHRLTNEKQEQK